MSAVAEKMEELLALYKDRAKTENLYFQAWDMDSANPYEIAACDEILLEKMRKLEDELLALLMERKEKRKG